MPRRMPSANRRGDGFSFGDASELLEKAALVVKLVPLVGDALEGVFGLASKICKDVEAVKSNKEDLRALAKEAALCTWAIWCELKTVDQGKRRGYIPYIQDLKAVCNEIDKSFHGVGQMGRLKRFLNKSAQESQISELRSQLSSACTTFGISIDIANKITLDQLRESITSIGEDIKAIIQRQIDAEMREKEIRQAQIDAEIRASLERLHPVSAAYNSDVVDKSVQYCAQDTRVELLTQIMDWACDDKVMLPVYWLSGLAGTGKSTVARTVCFRLAKEGILVASFFISGQIAERRDPAHIPGSLAYQIASHSPHIASHISAAINANPGITTRSISDQVNILIAQPLQKASPLLSQLIVVIDALDECEKRDGQEGGYLLPCLASALAHPTLKQRVRLLITSREEATIQRMFSEIQTEHGKYAALQLHMLAISTVQTDIKLYLELNLKRIATGILPPVQAGWPSQEHIIKLVQFSGGLFVVASTLVRFLDTTKHNPVRLLESVLAKQFNTYGSPYKAVDAMYTSVLDAAVDSEKDPDNILCRHLRLLLGIILTIQEPESPHGLSTLVAGDEVVTRRMLDSLGSLLVENYVVQIFHQSLRDFVTSPDRCPDKRLFIDLSLCHDHLAIAYLKQINSHIQYMHNPSILESAVPGYALTTRRQSIFKHAWIEMPHHISQLQAVSEQLSYELLQLTSRDTEPKIWTSYINEYVISGVGQVLQWCKNISISTSITDRLLVLLFDAFMAYQIDCEHFTLFEAATIVMETLRCHFKELNTTCYSILGQILHICLEICHQESVHIVLCMLQIVKAVHAMDTHKQAACATGLADIQRLLGTLPKEMTREFMDSIRQATEQFAIGTTHWDFSLPWDIHSMIVMKDLAMVLRDLFLPFVFPPSLDLASDPGIQERIWPRGEQSEAHTQPLAGERAENGPSGPSSAPAR